MEKQRLLISYAHPDDETFGQGGQIMRSVDEGREVYVICATNGDSGTVAPELLNGYASVAELRLAELQCAAEKLGITQVITLGYRDSGMMGDVANNNHPDSLWQAPREEVARRVVEVIRRVRPHVVVTFNEYGGYGHPDHIAIQRATTDAFFLAGDETYVTDGLAPYAPQKLYYSAMSTFQLRWYVRYMRLRGRDPRRVGRNKDIDLYAILENNNNPIHARVDVRDYLERWDEVNNCHKSQLGGGRGRYPLWLRKLFFNKQMYSRIYPEPESDDINEDDLFAGVELAPDDNRVMEAAHE